MVEIEGDSLTDIKKCISDETSRSEIDNVIRDIQQNKSGFKEICFKYLPRSANRLAYTIAFESLRRSVEV